MESDDHSFYCELSSNSSGRWVTRKWKMGGGRDSILEFENFAGKLYRKSDDEIILFDFIVYRTCVYYVYYKQYVNKLGKGWCIRLSIGIISLRKCEVYSRRRISTMNSFVEINRKILTRNSKIYNVSSSESGYIIRFERKSKLWINNLKKLYIWNMNSWWGE